MTDHAERDRWRRDLCEEHACITGAIGVAGLDLDTWAGYGDRAKLPEASRDQAGISALVKLDAAIGQLVAFRDRLAEAVRNPSATDTTGDDQP